MKDIFYKKNQLQSKETKYHTSINKELKKFYIKNNNTLYFHSDLKGDRRVWYTINKLSTELVAKDKTYLIVAIEWIVKDGKRRCKTSCCDLSLNIMTFCSHDMTLFTFDMTLCGHATKHKVSCYDKEVITP